MSDFGKGHPGDHPMSPGGASVKVGSSFSTLDVNKENAFFFPSHLEKALGILENDMANSRMLASQEAKQAVLDHVVKHKDLYQFPDRIMSFYYHQGIFPSGVKDPTHLGFSRSGRKLDKWGKEDQELIPFTKAIDWIKKGKYPSVPPLLRRVHVTEAIMSHTDTLKDLKQRLGRLEVEAKVQEMKNTTNPDTNP